MTLKLNPEYVQSRERSESLRRMLWAGGHVFGRTRSDNLLFAFDGRAWLMPANVNILPTDEGSYSEYMDLVHAGEIAGFSPRGPLWEERLA